MVDPQTTHLHPDFTLSYPHAGEPLSANHTESTAYEKAIERNAWGPSTALGKSLNGMIQQRPDLSTIRVYASVLEAVRGEGDYPAHCAWTEVKVENVCGRTTYTFAQDRALMENSMLVSSRNKRYRVSQKRRHLLLWSEGALLWCKGTGIL